MKVLMVSRYVEPQAKGANTNVVNQVFSLKYDHAVDVEILTWPCNDLWTGPVPSRSTDVAGPAMRIERGGLLYHLINPPSEWDASPQVLKPTAWDSAVEFGVNVLKRIRPHIVHLQHRHGMWWMLESAQRKGIPTVYSNHDWGLACLRVVLVMGDNSLCDGYLSVGKCSDCIQQGHGLIGTLNERVVQASVGRWAIEIIYRSPMRTFLESRGAVRMPVRKRVQLSHNRVSKVLQKLDALITPSEFGRTFFSRLGTSADLIQVLPWYHNPKNTKKNLEKGQAFTMTYIGRVSPEKGVYLIFDALSQLRISEPVLLRIAGANSSAYCENLRKRYPTHVGMHRVHWLGWLDIEPLILNTDVTVIPSLSIDNTPLSLIEAMSYRVPVIATDVPPIAELVREGLNGYLFEYNSIDSLEKAIARAVADKDRIRSGEMCFPKIMRCREYSNALKQTYVAVNTARSKSIRRS